MRGWKFLFSPLPPYLIGIENPSKLPMASSKIPELKISYESRSNPREDSSQPLT
jgi:hypothetical protein